jgi:hypothetical protein
MKYDVRDYTFSGLSNSRGPVPIPLKTLAYLVALADSAKNTILELETANFVLRYLFDAEEQTDSASELLAIQETYFPKYYYPQTPVMLTPGWSPISALLELGWDPVALNRENTMRACASGMWRPQQIPNAKDLQQCETPEELFWYVMSKVGEKASAKGLMISIVAKPGWSYSTNFGRPGNLCLAEAGRADRVIWQRNPRP